MPNKSGFGFNRRFFSLQERKKVVFSSFFDSENTKTTAFHTPKKGWELGEIALRQKMTTKTMKGWEANGTWVQKGGCQKIG